MIKDFFNRVLGKGGFSMQMPMQNYSMEWDSERYLRAYEVSPYVYTCVRKRAEKVGEIEFKLKGKTGDVFQHPILDLLYKPNTFQTKNEFFELLQIYRDLTGSAYIYVLRTGEGPRVKIQELHVLRPDWMTKVNLSKTTGLLESFTYRINGQDTDLPAQDVIPFYYPNPLKQFGGLSPVKAGRLPIDTAQQLQTYHNRILKNGGKIEGILSYKNQLTKEQVGQIKSLFSEYYEGAENAGKPFVTYGDAEYKNLGLTPTELSYLESLKMTRSDILMIYGVPKAIVAQTDDVNYANAKTAKEIFLSETIRPLIRSLVTKLDEFLVPEPFELSFVDPTPEDVELKLKQIDSGSKNYYLTLNEQRLLAGYDERPDGDVILVPFGLIPLGEKPADTTAKMKSIHPLQDAEKRSVYREDWIKRADKNEIRFRNLMKQYFGEQCARILRYINSGQPKNWKKKNVIDDAFYWEQEINLAKNAALPLIVEIFRKEGQRIFDLMGKDKDFRVTPSSYTLLDKRAELFAQEINDTTFKKLQATFEEGVANGDTYEGIAKRVSEVYDGFDEVRAKTIARTETLVASQSGTFSAYKDLNVPIKIWVAVQDGKTRHTHAEIDGEEVPIDDTFSNGLMYPGDPTGQASEVINCRCSI